MAHEVHSSGIKAGPVGRSLDWLRANLFSSWSNAILTLICSFVVWYVVVGFLDWALFSAVFTGSDGAACNKPDAGACWPFITHKLGLFMYGRYPDAERWRVNLTYVLALAGLVPLMIPPTCSLVVGLDVPMPTFPPRR